MKKSLKFELYKPQGRGCYTERNALSDDVKTDDISYFSSLVLNRFIVLQEIMVSAQ